ncbi:MAG TPA: Maf family protein [Candidatus Acidoferrales bacterium]|nr:Maf family protein [Candidatus Acidoferrales bacterium]
MMKLILASSSPRRAEVLADAGFTFEVVAARVDESRRAGEQAEAYVRRLAEAKARAVAGGVSPPAIVIAADTVVVMDGEVLGKPASAEDAGRMLRRLSGRTHQVLTGLAVLKIPGGAARVEIETTRVTFAPLTEAEIEAYVASGEPLDKAGAYAIQGRGGRLVARVEGCYFNVVGLPLARLYRILREMGWKDS